MDINELLNTNITSFKKKPPFPAGTYRLMITKYELLPFAWKKGTTGLMYVPTFVPVSSFEAEDEDNPELAAEQRTKLEAYGDWTKREFRYASDRDGKTMAWSGQPVNFAIIETDSEGNPVALMENQAAFFWNLAPETGEQSGWAHEVLGLDFPEGASITDAMEATVNREFYGTFAYEPNKDSSKPPNLNLVAMAPVEDE